MTEASESWDGKIVRKWLEGRILAARSDQVSAERSGRGHQDDCDRAAAEEMICALLKNDSATGDPNSLSKVLKSLLDRDDYVWRGVYDDTRFDRHVRAYIRKLVTMTKTNTGFRNSKRYQ